ncbi:MAG: DinB family protein [Pyrinomonadaceae bacterium]
MRFNLEHAADLLSRTPAVLVTMLRDLPAEWVSGNEGEQTWSPFDVVGHLIHGEHTDWMPRVRLILRSEEPETFETFDRFAQFEASRGKSLEELLGTFAELRAENLRALRELNITASDLERRGNHPELGEVTLEELLATWVVHDLDHIAQITRTMAKQYKAAVGPWTAYLSVLK